MYYSIVMLLVFNYLNFFKLYFFLRMTSVPIRQVLQTFGLFFKLVTLQLRKYQNFDIQFALSNIFSTSD